MMAEQPGHHNPTEWSHDLPEEWEAPELRRVAEISASNVDKNKVDGETAVRLCNYTDVYYNDIIDPDLDFMEATATAREIQRFQLSGGEVLLTKDSETAEDIAIPAYVESGLTNVICGYHLYLLRPDVHQLDGRFLMRACSVPPIRDQYVIAANGITRYGLGQQALASSSIPLPPLDVQRTIAEFLDRKTTEINDLIEQKQRLIELLQEKRTALITQAVTKGLAPDVEMKHSGLKWIGEIPAHWGITQLRRLTQPDRPIMYGIVLPGPDVANGVPIVKGGDVKEDQLRISALSRTSRDIESKHTRSRLQGGDLVYAIRGSIGEVEKVPAELIGANLTQDAARVSVRDGIHSDWLLYALRSRAVFAQLEAGSLGATIRGVNIRDLKRARLPLPPEAEQATIAGYLSQKTAALAQVHRDIGKAIDLLHQYRTGLISAAVTGRINVCEEARCSGRQQNMEEATNNGLG